MILAIFYLLVFVHTQETIVHCPTTNCLKIGFTYSGTGALKPESEYMLNGYRLFAEFVNEGRGIITQPGNVKKFVELVAINDQSESASGYQTLSPIVDFLLGPYGTSLTKQAISITNTSNKVLVFGNAAGDNVYEMGAKWIFGIGTTTKSYADNALPLLKKYGASTISIIHSNAEFAVQVKDGIVAQLESIGLKLQGEILSFPIHATREDIKKQLMKLKHSDVLIAAGLLRDGENIISIMNEINFKPKAIWMTSAPSDPKFIEKQKTLAEYLIGPSQWHESVKCKYIKYLLKL